MIVARIVAGMGNQMFQYAAAKSTAKRLGTELVLDLMHYYPGLVPSHVTFALDCFNLSERKLTYRCTETQKSISTWVKSRVRTKIQRECVRILEQGMKITRLLPDEKSQREQARAYIESLTSHVYTQQPPYAYTPDFEEIRDGTYMMGYWESPAFWNGMAKDIPSFFTFDAALSAHPLAPKIKEAQSVSIHVRRGDKLKLPQYLISDPQYIKSAVEVLTSRVDKPFFFIFSDDLGWCKKYLPPLLEGWPHCFVENAQKPAYIDLFLMTLCKHNIVGPGSFSWWGAYLNPNPGKIIVAPYDARKSQEPPHDPYLKNWIMLPSSRPEGAL
jgi:hypothetical protein